MSTGTRAGRRRPTAARSRRQPGHALEADTGCCRWRRRWPASWRGRAVARRTRSRGRRARSRPCRSRRSRDVAAVGQLRDGRLRGPFGGRGRCRCRVTGEPARDRRGRGRPRTHDTSGAGDGASRPDRRNASRGCRCGGPGRGHRRATGRGGTSRERGDSPSGQRPARTCVEPGRTCVRAIGCSRRARRSRRRHWRSRRPAETER